MSINALTVIINDNGERFVETTLELAKKNHGSLIDNLSGRIRLN